MFLIVVIAVALLAFILGDALTNGRNLFGNATTVAKVGGEKIDITDYQSKLQELNQQLEDARRQDPQRYANYDTQLLSEQALEQLINERLIKDAVEAAGIRTSPDMLRFMMLENPQPSPRMQKLLMSMNQNGIAVQSAQQAYDVIFNPGRVGLTEQQIGPFQREWLAIENEYKTQLAQMTYGQLLQGTFRANDLDRAAVKNDQLAMARVSVARQAYGNVDEKKYPVSDSEIKAAWDAEKNRYAVDEETKEISFISVAIAPSETDRKAASALAATVAGQLSKNGQLSKDTKKEGVAVERFGMLLSEIKKPAVKDYVASAPTDSVCIVSENAAGFEVIKMGKRSFEIDSIQVSMVQVLGKKLPSQVLAKLNSGFPADSIAKAFSADSVMSSPAQWLPLYTAEGKTPVSNFGMTQAQLDTLMNASGRFISLMESEEGSVLASITKKSAPKEVASYESVVYEIHPSETTINEARQKLEKFLARNNTAAKFVANAVKAGYNAQNLSLTQSSPAVERIPGMNMYFPDSRQVVRWVMIDGEKGDVSKIYQSKDASMPMLYAAAVTEAYDDYIPYTNPQVKAELTAKVRNSKAGDDLIKQYQGKGIEQIAAAMHTTPAEIEKFTFSRNPNVQDGGVIGRIMGSKPSQKVLLIKGADGVYAVVVKGNSTETFPMTDQQLDQMFMQMHQPDFQKLLRGARKIDNNIYKFEQGE